MGWGLADHFIVSFSLNGSATVVYALVNGTNDYDALSDDLGVLMTIPGAIMVLAGLGFGLAVSRAGVLPRWTGGALMAGVVLVALSQGAPEGAQVAAAGIRDLAFAGMGIALLRADGRSSATIAVTSLTEDRSG